MSNTTPETLVYAKDEAIEFYFGPETMVVLNASREWNYICGAYMVHDSYQILLRP